MGGRRPASTRRRLRTGERRGGSEQRCSRLLPEHVPAELLRHHRLQPAPLPGPLPGQPLPAKPRGPQKTRRGRAARSTVGHVSRRARVPGRAGPGRGAFPSPATRRGFRPGKKIPALPSLQPVPKLRGPGTARLGLKARSHVTGRCCAGALALFILAYERPPNLLEEHPQSFIPFFLLTVWC